MAAPAATIKQDPDALLAALKINKPAPVMASNVPPGGLGERLLVQTNVFGVIPTHDVQVYVYDLRIYADLTTTKTVEFTKKGKDDYLVNDRKEKCTTIFDKVVETNADFFGDKYKLFYDGQSLLFAVTNLFANMGDKKFMAFPIPGNTLPGDLNTLECVIVEIKAAETASFLFGQEAISSKTANRDLRRNEYLISQFMEVVMNDYAVMNPQRHKVFEYGKTFMCKPWEENFTERDCPLVGDGKRLMPGTQKSVKQIEGPLGRGTNNAAVAIDAKKAAFHVDQNCAEKMSEIIQESLDRELPQRSVDKIAGVMKGLFVETIHLKRNKRVQVRNLSKTNSITTIFETPDGKCSVRDYFQQKYNHTMKFPNAPLLICLERGQNNCYPAELCKVVPFQRVTIPQQTPLQSKKSTKECAVPPMTRQIGIMNGAKALEVLNEENPYIRNAGMKICPQPMKVEARVLKSAAIQYKNNQVQVTDGKWRTRGTQYLMPASCKVWAAYLVQENPRFNQNDFSNFVKKFYQECVAKGMQMAHPAEIKLIQEHQTEECLKVAAENNCQFALIVAPDVMDDIHKNMKLWEREFVIITQHIKMSNMEAIMVKGKMLTLENIINKTNCKLGGFNYGLDVRQLNGVASKWFTPDRLIIGVALSHPPPTAIFESAGDVPTVVGYAANMKASPFEYVGDYIFQDGRKTDTLTTLKHIVGYAVDNHRKSHNGQLATELIIYRSGLDEGAFGNVITREIPLLRHHLDELGVKMNIAFIVAHKETNIRLMREQINTRAPPPEQNIPPGIVVDTQLSHPAYKEFFLNSHTTLQGSARTPRYTILLDEINMMMDDIEGMTYTLAHNHQIVSLTTSLPAPLYIAQRYSERGRMVYTQFAAKEGSTSGSSSGQWDDVNKQLSYKGTPLARNRVNA